MKTVTKETFTDLHDRDSGVTIEDAEFVRCTFRGSSLSMARTPETRSTLRRVRLRRCVATGCFVMNPVLREVEVDGLKSGASPLFTWGALFDRVTLAGAVDNIVLSPRADPPTFPDADAAAFDAAGRSFYGEVEWALDIRRVEAQNLEVYGVPGELVRHDPETQAIARLDVVADEARWRDLDLADTWWPTVLETMITQRHEHAVLVTPLRHRRASAFVEGIKALRKAGVVE
ncbi:hypothetical protein ALI22I_16505 [Saccharothrix sp. ALI-22-I]|uniref:hypothetical protein n=1 Tax=Saccharothrix sp. ALI-22-I TaxID=1933778 RepID=UPI00097C01DE|nr:hypothetical protein [Saccharothrix sp. ALI-22-I]ONI89114.1 hypothetical protein ALI22I_16505 [Saccharothrix sp. ALI-22-I]